VPPRRRHRRPHRGPDRRPQGARPLQLEKLVGTIHQNRFKRSLDEQWAFLVYAGLWYEPLRENLDAYMDSVNEQCTGEITVRLFKGRAQVVARSSPNALYDEALAGFGESGGLFSQQSSPGFIELWTLQSRMAYKIRNRGTSPE
jgi:argininosuccinate synthase